MNPNQTAAYRISITGIVQGVGFRPFVYNLAHRLGLRGWVLNHSGGVDIEAEGAPGALDAFITALEKEAPPLAHITSLEATPIPSNGYTDFEIRHSEEKASRSLLISPDVATCDDCVRELFDPSDRRYRYPFINCTNCGPRFTIIEDIPYDRPKTTMREFPLCDDCREEYENPADRRFHAQPNACPVCGPHVWVVEATPVEPVTDDAARTDQHALRDTQYEIGGEDALSRVRDLLLSGNIVAIKGLGGFHLACDATNAEAVGRLRERKRRPHKPFAVMMPTLKEVRRHCEVPLPAEELLTSPQSPIVLLDRLDVPDNTSRSAHHVSRVADNVAPNQDTLGVMIPYTPLHHILLRDVGRPLVMTSGNLTEEPIAKDNDEALRRLATLADAFLLHNRDIYARYDDSVMQLVDIMTKVEHQASSIEHPVSSNQHPASSIEHPASSIQYHIQP
ncbi:MAG: Sua5/YciO/YrdC/YwlC family protein, partial [Anaerolineae bacterium]